MITDNCTDCLYSEGIPSYFTVGETMYTCKHENSPEYDMMVYDTTTCRLFVDYDNYIKLKDRKENIYKLLNKRK